MSHVVPSGGDFATAAVPVLPEAPVRFSTTTVTPSRCARPACASRATASTEPPGGNGTTILIGPGGQVSACAASACAASASAGRASAAASTTERLDHLAIAHPPDRAFLFPRRICWQEHF